MARDREEVLSEARHAAGTNGIGVEEANVALRAAGLRPFSKAEWQQYCEAHLATLDLDEMEKVLAVAMERSGGDLSMLLKDLSDEVRNKRH